LAEKDPEANKLMEKAEKLAQEARESLTQQAGVDVAQQIDVIREIKENYWSYTESVP
jgi:hypothetical protein